MILTTAIEEGRQDKEKCKEKDKVNSKETQMYIAMHIQKESY